MTRFCYPFPELVGARFWLPLEPFEFGWTALVGCNNLHCTKCGESVHSEVLPNGEYRRYTCGCHQRDVVWSYRIGAESEDLYPAFKDWTCAGHPDFVLPASLDGVRLDGLTDWDFMVANATLDPPFEPPGVELYALWITRLYRLLLGAERLLLSRAVARMLNAKDPRLVQAAYDFFVNEREAVGAERIAGSLSARRDWLSATPDPRLPSSPLIESAALALHERLLVVDDNNIPLDIPALEVAKEFALTGIGPTDAPLTFHDYDPEWLWSHADMLIRANGKWVDVVVYLSIDEPAARRKQVIRDIGGIAPVPVRQAIEQHFEEPERSRLLASIRR